MHIIYCIFTLFFNVWFSVNLKDLHWLAVWECDVYSAISPVSGGGNHFQLSLCRIRMACIISYRFWSQMQSSELSHSWTELIDMLHMLLDAVYASFSQIQPNGKSFSFFCLRHVHLWHSLLMFHLCKTLVLHKCIADPEFRPLLILL